MKIPHKCKFCSASITIELDDSILEFVNLEIWKSFEACNRCADFLESKRKLTKLIDEAALEWSWNKSRKESAERLRQSLVSLTQKFAALVCNFHHSHTIWEPDFAQQIMDQPMKSLRILNYYESAIRKRPAQMQTI